MTNWSKPVSRIDFIISYWWCLVIILGLLMLSHYIISQEHNKIISHITTEREVLQQEIYRLRNQLQAHDNKPEWFERKEGE